MKKLHPRERVRALKDACQRGKFDILYVDTETSLMKVYTFYTGRDVSIGDHQIIEESKIITIQWMFEGDTKASYLTWDDKQEDKKMIEKFTVEVLERPNLLVVGQNHKRFDYKVLAERSKLNRNTPMDLANIHTIDTLYSSRASFRSPSHKLDFRSRKYGLGGKRAMEFNDWVKIGNGDKKALAKMIKYGCKDVTDLRKIFWRELPYYLTLPAPIDKILRETATRCEFCAANKKASFNIKERYDGLFECLTCGDRWE